MSQINLPRWSEISREERFFTSMLFHDVVAKSAPILNVLFYKIPLPQGTQVEDIGFEVCFFRDAAFFKDATERKLLERVVPLEKQTFDLVLTLSTKRIVIIEAKAQQGFRRKQIDMLREARELMQGPQVRPVKKVHLVALWSSRYKPREETRGAFNACLTWRKMANLYPENAEIYMRADSIYSDRSRAAA